MAVKWRLEAIAPKSQYDPKLLTKLIRDAWYEGTKQIQREYNKTTRRWVVRPKFTIKRTSTGGTLTAVISTKSAIYGYVDEGTKPHAIRPKRAPALRFQTGFVPKTTPNVLDSTTGRHFGPFVYAQQVMHPGNAPRNFTVIIKVISQDDLSRRLNDALATFIQQTKE